MTFHQSSDGKYQHFVFLVSTERSGGNLLTALLDAHSRVCGPPPSHLFRLFANNLENYGDLNQHANWSILAEDIVVNFESQLGSWRTTIDRDALLERTQRRVLCSLLAVIYEAEADAAGAELILVKENQTWQFASLLQAELHGCRFVWLVRDPRDVAASWWRSSAIPGGVDRAVDVWLRDQEPSYRLYQQLAPRGKIIRLRYEDLVREPRVALQELTSFLGVDFEEGMLRFYERSATLRNASRIEAWSNLAKPVLTSNTGKYRTDLEPQEQRYVELACDRWMDRLGYRRELETRSLGGADRRGRLKALRAQLRPTGATTVKPEEREIRERRLAAMHRVLDRRV